MRKLIAGPPNGPSTRLIDTCLPLGFCGETEADHEQTLSLLDAVGYDMAYMFAYSVREKTHAHRRFEDDVLEDVKKRRLAEVIHTYRRRAAERFQEMVGPRREWRQDSEGVAGLLKGPWICVSTPCNADANLEVVTF
jgi:tRNA A37 methylthiotransferase MiaB